MKLPPARLAAFLAKPDPAVRVVVVYGPDAGLVRERARNLGTSAVGDLNDPFRVAALTGASVVEDPARLFDEMASLSLGGGKRLVRLQNPSETLTPILSRLLDSMPQTDSLLVIEAGDLDKRSKLRALAESENALIASIPCYAEDAAARQRTIAALLESEQIRAPREIVALLGDILPSDRLALRSEIEKFALYVGKGNAATAEDIHAVLQDAGAAELDDLVFAVGAGEPKRVTHLLDRLFAEQTAPVAILRAAQRHFLRLSWARAQLDSGLSATDAVKRLQPPVFWKHESAMAAQVRRWSRARSDTALRRLYDAEAAVKRTGTPDETLCAQTLLGLAA